MTRHCGWFRTSPRDLIIVSSDLSGAFYYYTDFVVLNYDDMDKHKLPEFFHAARMQGRRMYAVLADNEINGENINRTNSWRLLVNTWTQLGGRIQLLRQPDAKHFIFALKTKDS